MRETKFGPVYTDGQPVARNVLSALVERCRAIGIELELAGNYPWVYLNKVNGKRVTERFYANHGFTVAFLPLYPHEKMELTDIAEIFKIIRKYR